MLLTTTNRYRTAREAMMTPVLALILSVFPAAHQAATFASTVQLHRDSVTLEKAGKSKNFYSATISVGQPAQEFRVAFDLGGGTTMLPSASCKDKSCLLRHRFDKWASDTAVDIQSSGRPVNPNAPKTPERIAGRERGSLDILSADLGSGKAIGNFIRDRVCIGKESDKDTGCFPLSMLVAYEMSDVPFGLEPYDGTVGLSLTGMSVSPEFNFLDAFMNGYKGLASNSFALFLGGNQGGELTLGGYDANRLSHPLEWVTVAEPEEGRWQVAIAAIRVGNTTLSACRAGDCRAAIDYGASLLSVPQNLASGMEETLESLSVPSGYGDGCQMTVMPDLQLVLKNDVILTLPAEDYASQVSSSAQRSILSGPARSCRPHLAREEFDSASVGKATFVLGESVLRRYHTVFDGDSLKVGFSLALGSEKDTKALPLLSQAGKSKEWLKAIDDEEDGKSGSNVILLVQVKIKRSKTTSSLGL